MKECPSEGPVEPIAAEAMIEWSCEVRDARCENGTRCEIKFSFLVEFDSGIVIYAQSVYYYIASAGPYSRTVPSSCYVSSGLCDGEKA